MIISRQKIFFLICVLLPKHIRFRNIWSIKLDSILEFICYTTRKHHLNEGGFPRYFVVKEALRRNSEEARLLVTRPS